MEMWPSQSLIKLDEYFFLWTFLSNMSIYSIDILNVSLSVRPQKAEMLKYGNTIFSDFFLCKFYKSFVRWSVSQATKGSKVKLWKHNFLGPLIKIDDFLSVYLLLCILFYKYFVRHSVNQATKGRNVIIWKCNFLAS